MIYSVIYTYIKCKKNNLMIQILINKGKSNFLNKNINVVYKIKSILGVGEFTEEFE